MGPCQSDLDLTPRQAGCSADRRRRHRGGDRGYPCFLQCFGAYVCGGVAKPDISVDDHRALEPALLTSSIAPSSRTPWGAAPAFDFPGQGDPRCTRFQDSLLARLSHRSWAASAARLAGERFVRSMPRPQARPGNQSRAPPVRAPGFLHEVSLPTLVRWRRLGPSGSPIAWVPGPRYARRGLRCAPATHRRVPRPRSAGAPALRRQVASSSPPERPAPRSRSRPPHPVTSEGSSLLGGSQTSIRPGPSQPLVKTAWISPPTRRSPSTRAIHRARRSRVRQGRPQISRIGLAAILHPDDRLAVRQLERPDHGAGARQLVLLCSSFPRSISLWRSAIRFSQSGGTARATRPPPRAAPDEVGRCAIATPCVPRRALPREVPADAARRPVGRWAAGLPSSLTVASWSRRTSSTVRRLPSLTACRIASMDIMYPLG